MICPRVWCAVFCCACSSTAIGVRAHPDEPPADGSVRGGVDSAADSSQPEASTPCPGTVTLEFSSLPSAQGWEYATSGPTEASIFSADGSALHQNSIGTGLGPGYAYQHYILHRAIDTTTPFSIDVRARVSRSETAVAGVGGFGFGAFLGQEVVEIFVDTSGIKDANSSIVSTTVAIPEFHDYRLEVSSSPNARYRFFIDGALAATGKPRVLAREQLLWIGDGTSQGNALADVTRYRFVQCPL